LDFYLMYIFDLRDYLEMFTVKICRVVAGTRGTIFVVWMRNTTRSSKRISGFLTEMRTATSWKRGRSASPQTQCSVNGDVKNDRVGDWNSGVGWQFERFIIVVAVHAFCCS